MTFIQHYTQFEKKRNKISGKRRNFLKFSNKQGEIFLKIRKSEIF